MEEEVSVELSPLELAVLCHDLGLPGVAGGVVEPLGDVSSDPGLAAMTAGRGQLVERGAYAGDPAEVRPGLRAVLEVAGQPGVLLNLSVRTGAAEPVALVLAARPELAVEIRRIDGGTRLVPFAAELLLARALETVGLADADRLTHAGFTATSSVVTGAVAVARSSGVDDATKQLLAAGVAAEAAELFARAAAQSAGTVGVQIVHAPRAGRVEGGELFWVDGGTAGLFLVPDPDLGDDGGETTVDVVAVTPDEIGRELLSYLPV